MELSKGVCFFCPNTIIISKSGSNVLTKIKSVFNDSTLNEEQLNYVKPMKVCPICYHKINILKKIYEGISHSGVCIAESCLLCGIDKEVIKISKWDVFDKISCDFSSLTNSLSRNICSGCVFYLDTRNAIKEKLISVYPQLKVRRKIPKFEINITNHSTPIRQKGERQSKVVNKEFSSLEKSNLDIVQKLKPLKESVDLKLSKIVHKDPKFMNQVLIIKLQTLNKSLEDARAFLDVKETVTVEDKKDIKEKIPRKVKEMKQNECKEVNTEKSKNKNLTRKSRIRQLKGKEEEIVVISSESEKETNENGQDYRKKTYFKIKLGPKKNKSVKKGLRGMPKKVDKNKTINNCKSKLVIRIEQIKIPELRGIEETNVIESEDIFDSLKLVVKENNEKEDKSTERLENTSEEKFENTNEEEKMETTNEEEKVETTNEEEKETTNEEKVETTNEEKVETTNEEEKAETTNEEEKMETTNEEEKESTNDEEKAETTNEEEKAGTTNEGERMDTSTEEKNITEENENVSEQNGFTEAEESQENEFNGSEKSMDVEESVKSLIDGLDEDSNAKDDQLNVENPNDVMNETIELQENDTLGEKSDSEATEKNENSDSDVTEKNEGSDRENVETKSKENDKGTRLEEIPLVKKVNVQEIVVEDNEESNEEPKNSSKENSHILEDINNEPNTSLENNDYISEIEEVIGSFETISESEEKDDKLETVEINSTADSQEEDVVVLGKRKRTSSNSDPNTREKKKKKVTFREDIKSDD